MIDAEHRDFAGKKIAIFGAARSGIAAANLLVRLGADVVLSDVAEKQIDNLDPRVRLRFGANALEGAEAVVLSPGIMPGSSVVAAVRAAGVQILSEIEVAGLVAKAPIIAITGTDGKSTTTEMIGTCMRACGKPTVVAGNIGVPLCEKVLDVDETGVIVAEVSAFQLWSCGYFAPKVSIITNIAEDHAEYFEDDTSAYIAAKARVLSDMAHGGVAILRGDDAVVAPLPLNAGVKRVLFSLNQPIDAPGFSFDGTTLYGNGHPLMAQKDLPVFGRHNVLNALAALAATDAMGCDLTKAVEGLRHFKGLDHRLELVCEHNGIRWFDDSKATNPHASAVGLRALNEPLVVIAGGYEKGLPLDRLLSALKERAHHVVVMGDTADRIAKELGGALPLSRATDMESAVRLAAQAAVPGDAVVLSPAASSYDHFKNFNQRGDLFKAAVRAYCGIKA